MALQVYFRRDRQCLALCPFQQKQASQGLWCSEPDMIFPIQVLSSIIDRTSFNEVFDEKILTCLSKTRVRKCGSPSNFEMLHWKLFVCCKQFWMLHAYKLCWSSFKFRISLAAVEEFNPAASNDTDESTRFGRSLM